MKRIIIIIVVLGLGLSIALFFQLIHLDAYKHAPSGGSGVVEGTEVDITARIPARIEEITVQEGQQVKASQLLVKLQCTEPLAGLKQARASVSAAEASVVAAKAAAKAAAVSYSAARKSIDAIDAQLGSLEVTIDTATKEAKRVRSMTRAGAMSEARLDTVSSNVKSLQHQILATAANRQASFKRALAVRVQAEAAKAKIEAAKSQLEMARSSVLRAQAAVDECSLLSPISGVVMSRNFEPGEAVLPGSKILTIVKTTDVRVTFFLPNAELASASLGKTVSVIADAWPGNVFKGKIIHVEPKAEFTPRNVQTREDRDRLVYGVKIMIPNPDGKLRPGMPVEVRIDGTSGRDQ